MISFDSADDTEKTLVMTDLSGKVLYSTTYSGLEKNTKYTRTISKSGYLNGMYMFYLKGSKVVSSDKELKMK